MIWPNRPLPAMMAVPFSVISSSSLPCFLLASGNTTLSNKMNNIGVSIIDMATTNNRISANSGGMTAFCTVNDSSTKPNSPAWARLRANSHLSARRILVTKAMASRTIDLSTIRPMVRPRMSAKSLNNRPKLIPAPTVMKNRPRSRPLNGSMSLSSS